MAFSTLDFRFAILRSKIGNRKSEISYIPLFLAMIALGSALALYADSPLLVIPFLGALALTSFAALDYALYILVGFLPFSFRLIMLSGTEMQVPTEPLLAAMAVALVLRWIVMGRGGIHIKFPFRFPLLVYGVSLCLSMINAGHVYSAAKGSLRVIAYMMLSVVVFNVVTDKRRLKRLFVVSIVPATVAVGWTVIFLADRLEMWRWSSAYEGLPFTSYSHYGAFVVLILLILLARFIFDKSSYDRVIWTILLGFYFIAICFSFSRGVWVSFIAAIGFVLFQRSKGIQHKKVLMIGGAIAFFSILLSMPHISDLIISRTKTIISFGYGANRERVLRWGTALMMFLRHPITGCGYGSFAFSYVNNPEIIGTYLTQFGMGAHSEYLQILAETGLIGFSSWMWVIISFFLYGFRLLKKLGQGEGEGTRERVSGYPPPRPLAPSPSLSPHRSFYRSLVIGIMAAEASLLVHFLVNNLIQSDIIGVPFWLLIGLLPAIGNIVEKENQHRKE
jgi:putative inorganic carbon (HCO3(-)) transporter